MVTTAPVPPSTVSPTSSMNVDPAVHHAGVITPLEVAVNLPTGLPASSSLCRCLAQAGPAPVPPRALPFAACHPSLILPGGVQPAHLLPGRFPCQIGAPPVSRSSPSPGAGTQPCGGQRHQCCAIPPHPLQSLCPSPATGMAVPRPNRRLCTHGSCQCCSLAWGRDGSPAQQPTDHSLTWGTLNTLHVLCLPGCLQGHYRSLCQHAWLPLAADTTALASQHPPLAQEQLARVSVAAGGAEGSREPLVLLAVPCHPAGPGLTCTAGSGPHSPGRPAAGHRRQSARPRTRPAGATPPPSV